MLGQIVKSNNPLKIISGLIVKQVAKWGLILALGSQLIVLLKAGWHELILNVPIWFDKLKAGLVAEIVTIPDKFMLTLRQALQGTTLGSMMGFGGLTKEEKTERDNIGKEKLENGQKVKDLVLKSQQGIGEFQNLAEGLGLNPDDYNMNDKVSRGKLIGDIKRELVRRKNEGTLHDDPRLNEIFGIPGTFEGENGDENAYIAFTNKLNNQTSRWGEAIDAANNLDAFSEEDREKILRYTELTERMAPKKLTDEEKQAKNAEIKAKKEEAYSQSLTESYTKRLNAGEAGTEYQQQEYAAAGANVRQAQAAWSEAHGGREFNRMETTTKGERVAEHYLTHEFMEWKQAWADLGKHLSQNIGVSVVQKVERDNVLNCNGRR